MNRKMQLSNGISVVKVLNIEANPTKFEITGSKGVMTESQISQKKKIKKLILHNIQIITQVDENEDPKRELKLHKK